MTYCEGVEMEGGVKREKTHECACISRETVQMLQQSSTEDTQHSCTIGAEKERERGCRLVMQMEKWPKMEIYIARTRTSSYFMAVVEGARDWLSG